MKKEILAAATSLAITTTASAENLIPREELFRQPACLGVKISPDGQRLAYIGADKEGTMNLFVGSGLSLEGAKQVTDFKEPRIGAFHWSADNKKILMLKDQGGSMQYHLYCYHLDTSELTHLTSQYKKIVTKIYCVSSTTNKAVIGINARDPSFHDLYSLDIDTGMFTLIYENSRYINFLFDDDLRIAIKVQINSDSSLTLHDANDKELFNISAEDAFQTECLRYDASQKALYLIDNRGCNTTQLKKIYLDNRQQDVVLGHDQRSDIHDVLFEGGEPVAFANYFTQKEWHPLNAKAASDIQFLSSSLGPNFEISQQSKDGQVWIIRNSIPDQGNTFWLYSRQTKLLTLLYSFPKTLPLSKKYPVVIPSRDGLSLVSYLTLPKDHDQQGTAKKPLPLVVFPHGGPFKLRDAFVFNPFHQWLADRGYAVLSVNFRLSFGFGKDFVNAGNGQWGKKAHEDILDAVQWCIDKKIADPEKIAMMGGSYGGYETLAALTFSPDVFCCGIAVCGPSNLKTVLDNVPFYWEFPTTPLSDKYVFYTKNAFKISCGGDPAQEKGNAYLQSCSPLNFVDNIKKPLLLVHGENDFIVAASESDQIYEKMKQKNLPTIYISFPDEGHGVIKFANSMSYLAYSEWLLSQVLGGKFEPLPKEQLEASSARIQSNGMSTEQIFLKN